MASPTESRVDENEVTSNPHQRVDLNFADFPLTRQSSIYSLTLDEIQNTVCEPGRTFGSMNMDEFLSNIWNVEEGINGNPSQNNNANTNVGPALHRQGSLSLPAPLSRKTVDEVWADIHRGQEFRNSNRAAHENGSVRNAQRQPTFGEMTLEDFLVKAGVVRETHASQQQPVMQGFMQQNHGVPMSYPSIMSAEYHPQVRCRNGYGMQCGGGHVGSPISPVSSDGFGGQGGLESGMVMKGGGSKRGVDGCVEKVVERRQRRMIKNRESAARSRARKQAYTVELEAELNNLREINDRLGDDVRRMQILRKKVIREFMAEHARINMIKSAPMLRRISSGPW